MRTLKVSSFKDLMNGHATARIKCLVSGDVVRTLTLDHERGVSDGKKTLVMIDSGVTEVTGVPIDTEIYYEPWDMDRGSLLFKLEGYDSAFKICTEGDIGHYPKDAQCCSILPASVDPVKTAIVDAANLDLDNMRAENYVGNPTLNNTFDAETHALALEGLIDGEPCDDLGRVLQPIVNYLRRIH